jgi:hypothetical protein
MKKIFDKLLQLLASSLYAYSIRILKYCHPEWHSRSWSNAELLRWAEVFTGDIINVSGWDDRDKEGRCYADYFTKKNSYTISNIAGARGLSGKENEIFLDLTKNLEKKHKKKYDVVFNHTTIEHIFEVKKAFSTICSLSKDIVIIVLPFMQPIHWEKGSFLDYWRFTPFSLYKMFTDNGFKILYLSCNNNPVFNIYIFCIATRDKDKWRDIFDDFNCEQVEDTVDIVMQSNIGNNFLKRFQR